jgi:predicted amidohydrolase YtcJ
VTAVRFENAKVLILERRVPGASALLVQDGIIQAKGTADRVVDLDGAIVVPGFVDNHCHLLAMATWSTSIDCGPTRVGSIDELIARLSEAMPNSNSGWLFGVGYDDLLMAERRHPAVVDLDRVTTYRPILLTHSSGHAHVVNSTGLALLGITASSAEPPSGTIARIGETGEPSGLLLEMGEFVSDRMPRVSESEREAMIASSLCKLASFGVTSITDAGPRNDMARVALLSAAAASMLGGPRLRALVAPGIKRGELESDLAALADFTKVMLTRSSGTLSHGSDELRELAIAEHAIGAAGVAVHAVEVEAVVLAAQLASTLAETLPDFGIRIEHASEAVGDVIDAVARSGATVVTQPGFIWSRGDRYVAGGAAIEALYPLRGWLTSQTPLAYGSDAPYGPVSPLIAIQAAVTRRSSSGQLIGGDQTIDVSDALRLVTSGVDGTQRTLLPGQPADFVVLSDNPMTMEPDRIGEIQIIATYVAGRKTWPLGD